MKIIWTERAESDFKFFLKQDRRKAIRVTSLIDDILLNGLDKGIGKPERLKYNFSGCYSRRVDEKNRLVYSVDTIDDKMCL